MNNGTTYHNRAYPGKSYRTAGKIVPPVGNFHAVPEKNQRCRRSCAGSNLFCTGSDLANGFLKSVFLPKLTFDPKLPLKDNRGSNYYQEIDFRLDRQLKKSLKQLCSFYDLQLRRYKTKNRLEKWTMIITEIQNKLRVFESSDLSIEVSVKQREDNVAFLQVIQEYNVDTCLYFIPVVPLYKMLRQPDYKQVALILLSAFCYLYSYAGIPFYIDDYSYIAQQYDIYREWVMQDEEEDLVAKYEQEIEAAFSIGRIMWGKLIHKNNLKYLIQRLANLDLDNELEADVHKIGTKILWLWQNFPIQSIFDKSDRLPDDDERYESVRMYQYISFVGDSKGWLYDLVREDLETYLGEYGRMEQPLICYEFNGSELKRESLHFEKEIFNLIGDLNYILENYKQI